MSLRFSLSILLLRLVVGTVFILHGYPKLATPEPFVQFFASHGIPGGAAMVTFVGVVEFLGGILLVAGLLTRASAFLLAIDMLVALFGVELREGFALGAQFVTLLFTANVVLLLLGAGFISFDQWVKGHQYLLSRFFVIALLFVIPLTLQAAGGGGGGSVPPPPVQPSCTEDTWTCGDWSVCERGTQERTCTLTNDCVSMETAKPAGVQGCTVPCSKDVWTRTGWSTCGADSVQHGLYTLTNDCPAVESVAPNETQACTPPVVEVQQERPVVNQVLQKKRVWCLNLQKMKDRILCRLQLTREELAEELKRQYLPEECRALPTKTKDQKKQQKTCVVRYKAFQPCWAKPVGPGRTQCAENVLYKDPLLSYLPQCAAACEPRVDRYCCRSQQHVKTIADLMVKFRMYDLSERAEEIALPKNRIAKFVFTVEQTKQKYNASKNVKQKRQLVLAVRKAWKQFVSDVKKQKAEIEGGDTDGLDAAFTDLAAAYK
ncbi:DoxX family protein [Candidatus Uhrbacteria bacterium]|nr:DoxX family protein [Candidatus Uhrbacteria bacterium]